MHRPLWLKVALPLKQDSSAKNSFNIFSERKLGFHRIIEHAFICLRSSVRPSPPILTCYQAYPAPPIDRRIQQKHLDHMVWLVHLPLATLKTNCQWSWSVPNPSFVHFWSTVTNDAKTLKLRACMPIQKAVRLHASRLTIWGRLVKRVQSGEEKREEAIQNQRKDLSKGRKENKRRPR